MTNNITLVEDQKNNTTQILEMNSNLRFVIIKDQAFFVLADILKEMKTTTTVSSAKNVLESIFGKGSVKNQPLLTNGGEQELIVVSEPCLTYLVAQGKTKASKELNLKIHTVILPSIKNTGKFEIKSKQKLLEIAKELVEVLDLTPSSITINTNGSIKITTSKKKEEKIIDYSLSIIANKLTESIGRENGKFLTNTELYSQLEINPGTHSKVVVKWMKENNFSPTKQRGIRGYENAKLNPNGSIKIINSVQSINFAGLPSITKMHTSELSESAKKWMSPDDFNFPRTTQGI